MISKAEAQFKSTQQNMNRLRINVQNSEYKKVYLQVGKEQLQVAMAKELTIADYFVGYLTKQTNVRATIPEVAKKMTPNEVSELMQAYADNFFDSKPAAQNAVKATTRAGFNQ